MTQVPAWDATQPITFQCDSLTLKLNSAHQICRGNVRVHQGDLRLCCEELSAEVIKDTGRIKTLRLRGDVRAAQGDDAMWAEAVTYVVKDHLLVLTGRPLLQRESSRMSGSKVAFDLANREATVTQPTGVWAKSEGGRPLMPAPCTTTPDRCPLPPRPSL